MSIAHGGIAFRSWLLVFSFAHGGFFLRYRSGVSSLTAASFFAIAAVFLRSWRCLFHASWRRRLLLMAALLSFAHGSFLFFFAHGGFLISLSQRCTIAHGGVLLTLRGGFLLLLCPWFIEKGLFRLYVVVFRTFFGPGTFR